MGKFHIDAFNDIFSKKDNIVRFAQYYIGERSVAEDVVMDSFLYCWERKDELADVDNKMAYLVTIVKHKCIDYLRAEAAHAKIESKMQEQAQWDLEMSITAIEAFDPDRELSEENIARVRAAIASLPEKTKMIFLMNRIDEKTYREIAAETGMSEKNVEYHISKALRLLRRELKDISPVMVLLIG